MNARFVGALALAVSFVASGTVGDSTEILTITEVPRDANAFVDAIGVNVHLDKADSAYVIRFAQIRTLLRTSGIRHIRAPLIDAPSEAYLGRLEQLARDGIQADLVTTVGQTPEEIRTYATRIPGAIEAFEGPNEVDINPQHGADWVATLRAFIRVLYATVHGSPATARDLVIAPSLTTEAAFRAVGDLAPFVDRGNTHDYFAGFNPGTRGWGATDPLGTYGALSYDLALARVTAGAKPIVSTETGYGTDPSRAGGVPMPIATRYLPRLLFEHWNAGIARTYLYELVDVGNDDFAHFGLLDGDAKPKPTLVALAKLIALLSSNPGARTRLPLRFALTDDIMVHHALLERAGGDVLLALWVEAPGWDPNRGRVIDVPVHPVTLVIPGGTATVRESLFEDSGAVTVTRRPLHPGGSMTIAVTDHLTILDLGVHHAK